MAELRKKILALSLLLFLMVASLQFVAQYTAFKFHYHPSLGEPIVSLLDMKFYGPHQYFDWFTKYRFYQSKLFQQTNYILMGLISLSMLFTGLIYRLGKKNENPTTYGSARWAEWKDIEKMELTAKTGVVLGKFNDKYLIHNGPEHVLVNAPSRSGKGVGLVIPTLLTWPHSVLVLDIKRENWSVTSGFRNQFSHCLCFDPTSKESTRWNPLLEVRKGEFEVRDVQNIADILVDPDGRAESHSHWEKTGHALLVATILHVLYAEKDKTLRGVANFLADPNREIHETLKVMMETPHIDGVPHPIVASAAREMLNKAENEFSGVLSTAMSFLGLYRDPIVAKNTETSDFMIDDLVNYKDPVSLYLAVPPSDLSRTRPLMRLMLNMVGRRLTECSVEGQESPHKHRLLMLLDEFPSLGRLDFFESAMAFLAGYGIKVMLICQSLRQLDKNYGRDNSILDNCHIRAVMAPNDEVVAKRISDMLGQTTLSQEKENYSGNRMAFWLSNKSVSNHEVGRPLLTPDEVMQLDQSKLLIMVAGSPVIMANKIKYYIDVFFKARILSQDKDFYCLTLHDVTHEWITLECKQETKPTLIKNEETELVL